MASEHWIVVGAGSAGCVVAARLSDDPNRHVTLLDDGPDLAAGAVPASIDGPSFLDALTEPGRTHPDLLASRTSGGETSQYLCGRGIGGSSSVNAMVALRGNDSQYRSWGWNDTAAAWGRVEIPSELPTDDELGPVDHALLAADGRAVRARLTRRSGRRVTAAEAYLWPIRDRSNLTVRPDTAVDRLTLTGRTVTGVRLVDGTTIDADRTVLCAGALHTPTIMLRSGLDTPGIGDRLQDHPSAPLTLQLRAGVDHDPSRLALGTLLDAQVGADAVQVLPMNHLGRDAAADGMALLMPALMTPRSRAGTVRIDEAGRPVVDFALLDDAADAAALAEGVRIALGLLAQPSFRDIVETVWIDDAGTTAGVLDDDESLQRWVRSHPGDYVHASGTCAMGTVVDERGAVAGYDSLSVCDASIFPHIPDVNTHLPVTMAAERLCVRGRMFS